MVRRLIATNLAVFVLLLSLAPAGTVLAANDRLEMRYACEVKDGKLQLMRSLEPRSYPIMGERRQRKYTACKDPAGRDCKSMIIHQFDMSCGGSRVAWYEVAALMRGGSLGPSRVEDGQLHFVVAAPPAKAGETQGAPGGLRYARFILPPGFAPIAEVGSRLQVGGVAGRLVALNEDATRTNGLGGDGVPVAVNIPVPVAKPTLAARPAEGLSTGGALRTAQTDIPKTLAGETQLAQGWSASIAPPAEEAGLIGPLGGPLGGLLGGGAGLPSGWLMALVGFLAVTSALAGAGFVVWRRGGMQRAGTGISDGGEPVVHARPAVVSGPSGDVSGVEIPLPAGADMPASVMPGPVAAGTSRPFPAWSVRGREAMGGLKARAGQAARSSSGVLGVAAGRGIAAMVTLGAGAVSSTVTASRAAGSGLASMTRAGAGVAKSAMCARATSATKPAGGVSLRERLERVGQAFGETVVPAKTAAAASFGAAPRSATAQGPAETPAPSRGNAPNGGHMPLQGRMDASNVASGLKSVEALFEQVAEVVGDVKPESPLRETLEFELRNIAHRISVFVGTGEQPPTGPRAAATLRGAVRDLERVRRIADSAAASFSSGLHIERLSRLPQSKGEAYQVLGVNADVSEATLKKIVDALRMSWHPDLAKDEADRVEREDRIKQINIAWEIINDKRAA